MSLGKGLITLLMALVWAVMPAMADEPGNPTLTYLKSPEWLGPVWVEASEWANLEEMVESLASSRSRAEDGQYQLYKLTNSLHAYFTRQGEDRDELLRTRLADYRAQYPKSAFAVILPAMQLHAAAWRARGRGFASTITPEGEELWRERNKEAWKVIRASKMRGDRLPAWYEQAISIGLDARAPFDDLTALFNEGIERFPGYDPIYFAFTRQFAPRWGGSYEEADAFITAQVAAKTNVEGEELYTRLYWLIDDYEAGSPGFFAESFVDWSRMKAGFEQMLKEFPNSKVYPAAFASYACRAADVATYMKLRATVSPQAFADRAPEGISLEVCDARFIKKT
jgi:hypothetical protein